MMKTVTSDAAFAAPGCHEASQISRRGLLGAGVSLYAWAHMGKVARATGAKDPRLLVVILRGALDGLSAVPPISDPAYAALRGEIAIASEGTFAALPLDGFFALHPAMKTFARLYREKKASVIHAVATPYRERSHFDGQDLLESGYDRAGRVDSGWLNRALLAMPRGERINTRGGLGIGPATPLILRGEAAVMGWAPQTVPQAGDDLAARLLDLYQHRDPELGKALLAGLDTDRLAKAEGITGDKAKPQGGAADPRGMIQAAQGAARLLAASDGPRVAALSFDGWDTHANQGGATGRLATLLGGLDGAFAAFEEGLKPVWNDTAVIVVTEFGRTARVNGTVGSDHGTGTVAFLLGGAIAGGKVFADWPGLREKELHEGRDLRPTADLRAIFKGLLRDHLGISSAALAEKIFPGSQHVAGMNGLVT
ncbi:MAG: DUF1501 domain-containing protein [Beijerinckiaceae bacterium]